MSEMEPYSNATPASGESSSTETGAHAVPFFLVGTRKLVVLTIVTFGLYEAYWFYKHWRRLQRVGGEDIWPVPRTIFAGLFCYWLFSRVTDEADGQGVPSLLSPAMLAILYFVGLSSSRLGAPAWVTLVVTLVPLGLAQAIVNGLPQVRALDREQRNEHLSKKNWAGVAGFALVILLLLLPEPPPATAEDMSVDVLVEAANSDLPRTMLGGVVLERVERSGGGVGMYVRLDNVDHGKAAEADVVAGVRHRLLQAACARDGFEAIVLGRGLPLRYTISSKGRTRLATLDVMDRAQCAAAPP